MFVANRLCALREAMLDRQLDVLYIRSLSNLVWLTGFEDVFDDEPAHLCVVSADYAGIHSDSRYRVALLNASAGSPFEISDERISHVEYLLKTIKSSVSADKDVYRVGIEDTLLLREYRGLKTQCAEVNPCIELVELSGFVEGLRQVKDSLELDAMKKAQAITDAAFAHIVSYMKEGITEREIQLELDRYMLDQGADGLAFSSIVASGPNGALPHARPGNRKLQAGDCVVLDFGARWGGYCSDMTRCVFVGEPSDELKRAWEVLRRTNEMCSRELCAGKTGKEIHEQAEKLLEEGGFGGLMGHGLGHSLGIDIHEEPSVSLRNVSPFEAGNVVTVEPGIYVEGRFGMRLEDFGVVTDTGFKVLTQTSHEMVII